MAEEKKTPIVLSSLTDIIGKKYFLHNKIPIYLKDLMALNIQTSLDKLLEIVELKVPEILIPDLNTIWIGDFPELDKMNVDSFYKNGTVYFSNKIPSIEIFYFTFLYEMSNVIAQSYNIMLLADAALEREFIKKRIELYNRLTTSQRKVVSVEKFLELKHNASLFRFLYKKLRKTYLDKLCKDIYPHRNSISSYNSYFAMTYYLYKSSLKPATELEKISPAAFSKVKTLIDYAKGY